MPDQTQGGVSLLAPVRWAMRHAAGTVALLAVAVVAVAGSLVWHRLRPMEWETVERCTMEFLQQEELMFLVTDRVVTRIDVTFEEGSMLLGWRECLLIGTVEFLCGVDLQKISAGEVRGEGNRVVITVPDPEVLKVSVDTASLTRYHKRSGLIALKDFLERRDVQAELTARLEARAREFAAEQGLLPARRDMVKRLNDWAAPLLEGKVGADVEFR